MNTLNIVFGNSCLHTMNKSKIGNNVLMFNVLFNVADLSNIENYEINIPDKLKFEERNVKFKCEHDEIVDNIKKQNKIRVWCGKNDIYSYLIMLYVCSIIKEYNYDLYIVYSDDYNKDYLSPAQMTEVELNELLKFEHKLSNLELIKNVDIWEKIINENSKMRIIDNGNIKSVSIHYYDDYILKTLKEMGEVRMSQLVGRLMSNIYLTDTLYVYLIDKLIKNNKIKILLSEDKRYFENLISLNN